MNVRLPVSIDVKCVALQLLQTEYLESGSLDRLALAVAAPYTSVVGFAVCDSRQSAGTTVPNMMRVCNAKISEDRLWLGLQTHP